MHALADATRMAEPLPEPIRVFDHVTGGAAAVRDVVHRFLDAGRDGAIGLAAWLRDGDHPSHGADLLLSFRAATREHPVFERDAFAVASCLSRNAFPIRHDAADRPVVHRLLRRAKPDPAVHLAAMAEDAGMDPVHAALTTIGRFTTIGSDRTDHDVDVGTAMVGAVRHHHAVACAVGMVMRGFPSDVWSTLATRDRRAAGTCVERLADGCAIADDAPIGPLLRRLVAVPGASTYAADRAVKAHPATPVAPVRMAAIVDGFMDRVAGGEIRPPDIQARDLLAALAALPERPDGIWDALASPRLMGAWLAHGDRSNHARVAGLIPHGHPMTLRILAALGGSA